MPEDHDHPLLGRDRFLVLYVGSALGGSVVSTLVLGEGISFGASGAVWGLVSAQVMLTLRPAGLMPSASSSSMRRATLTQVGMLLVGLLELDVQVGAGVVDDWVAVLGGGIAGGLMVLTGVLMVGRPRLDESRPVADVQWLDWARAAALLSTGMLALAGALALLQGTPWR